VASIAPGVTPRLAIQRDDYRNIYFLNDCHCTHEGSEVT
jgi:hypothetical protein